MSTAELTITERPELVQFRRQDAAIAELAEKYLPLKINGLDDRKGFLSVHEARMEVKGFRVLIEKTRKELKADALKYGQTVDAEAKRLTALVEPIELHLEREEDAIVDERLRLKQIEEDAKRAALQKRLDALAAVGCVANPVEIQYLAEPNYQERLAEATAAHAEKLRIEAEAAEQKRLADEAAAKERAEQEAALAAERERQAVEARKLEAERAAIAAERAAVVAEREKQEAAEHERRRLADLEKAKAEAAEHARLETERRIAEKAAADKAAAEAVEAARVKAEAERPYRDKLIALAGDVQAMQMNSGPAAKAVNRALAACAKKIIQIAEAQELEKAE